MADISKMNAPSGLAAPDAEVRRLKMLLDISRNAAALESLDEVLDILVQAARQATGADRGTLFLNDDTTNELYSRIAQGDLTREIRILNTYGLAGAAYQTSESIRVDNAYKDDRFDKTVDEETGYRTETVLAVPIITVRGETIGVVQMLNKPGGFTADDEQIVAAITTQCAVTLQSLQSLERMQQLREQETEFLNVVSELTSELDLRSLLARVMGEATRMLDAERSTLFLHDKKTDELFSHVGDGLDSFEIRIPSNAGIAGAVFQSGEMVNIPHAYADLRFNPGTDKQTGFFTRSMVCVPVMNKQSEIIGVTQVLNKRGGPFTEEDIGRLKAFTAQIAIGLENAQLFADVQAMQNYNNAMLQSMSNGVVTFDEDRAVRSCNKSGARILHAEDRDLVGLPAAEMFTGDNAWLIDHIDRVFETSEDDIILDAELAFDGEKVSANIAIMPLVEGGEATSDQDSLGALIMIEDISNEKRVKSTLSRYMDPGLADQILEGGDQDDYLGGRAMEATVLFSDIRSFTTISESLGATGTVSMLNDYFTIMVDCITSQGGMLDKFIGDAIMAIFGIPMAGDDDPDRAARAAINMLTELNDWNKSRAARGEMEIRMGLGLNTDQVVSGNIGSPRRMDYTVIGDGVNLAARLESACKQYGAELLISEYTAQKLSGIYRMRDLDRVIVKGKTEPVAVYEVIEHYDDAAFPNAMDVLGHFKEGIAAYRGANFAGAIPKFEAALAAHPNDKASSMYIDRCRQLIESPPEGEWKGVWTMTSK